MSRLLGGTSHGARLVRSGLRGLWEGGRDLLFPLTCAACDARLAAHQQTFCARCAASLWPIDPRDCCRRCAAPKTTTNLGVRPCVHCRLLPPDLARIFAPLRYGGALRDAILRLKWSGRDDLAAGLAAWLLQSTAFSQPDWDGLVPVPLHPRRLAQRGYNQAALLGVALHNELARRSQPVPALLFGCLLRRTDSPPQKTSTVAERFAATRDAFACHAGQPGLLVGKRLLLIDDVVTTGATAAACAKLLRSAGAAEVSVLALARAGDD